MQTTKHFLLVGLLCLYFGQVHAQTEEKAEARPVLAKEDPLAWEHQARPVMLGLPDFIMNTATSLRTEPDHRSKVQIRLRPGMRVEVLDPVSHRYWTKVRIGDRIGWAKKHCMDPESGEFEYGNLSEVKELDL